MFPVLQPNWCGTGGMPAVNERKLAASGRILQHICDPLASPEKFLGTPTNLIVKSPQGDGKLQSNSL